jgi:SAM-dependent methyltransferase
VNSSRVYLKQFLESAAATMQPNARLLDAGAGDEIYKSLFGHTRYESTDFGKSRHMAYAKVDYIADLANIPVIDRSYDHVICTQVLEHVPDPQKVIHEFWRVLKPNGTLWLSTPLFYEEHMPPHDFFRYTQFGLQRMLTNAGFEVKQIEWLEGYYGTLSYQLDMAAHSLEIDSGVYGGGALGVFGAMLALILKPSFFALSKIFAWLDLRHKFVRGGMCKNFTVVSRKPQTEENK